MEPDPGDLNRLIDDALHEIDQARADWSGWSGSVTEEHRRRLRDREAEIDLAALAGDRRRLTAALAEYKAAVLNEIV